MVKLVAGNASCCESLETETGIRTSELAFVTTLSVTREKAPKQQESVFILEFMGDLQVIVPIFILEPISEDIESDIAAIEEEKAEVEAEEATSESEEAETEETEAESEEENKPEAESAEDVSETEESKE